MAVTSTRSRSNFPTTTDRTELRARVGAFVRERRQQLGLRLVDMSRAMGYRSPNAISNVESGFEGIPAKRAYAWAELLELPRDLFFQFITGEIQDLDAASVPDTRDALGPLSADEQALISNYRQLPPASRARLRAQAVELAATPAARRHRRR